MRGGGVREERIKHALTGEKRLISAELFGHGARLADRPDLEHRVLGLLIPKLQLEYHVLHALRERGGKSMATHIKRVIAGGSNKGNLSARLGRNHDAVRDEVVLRHLPKDVAA